MKKLNLYELFVLGKRLSPLTTLKDDQKTVERILDLWWAREGLLEVVAESSIFLPTSKRAASNLIAELDKVAPRQVTEFPKIAKDTLIGWYPVHLITTALNALETVLTNDMPGISAYFVVQKGIYRTDDLIAHADLYFAEDIRKDMPEKSREDWIEAGKCLAYEIPTACSFHLWRAVETVMCHYYEKLTGQTVKAAKVARNWGAYIKALNDAGAENKITEFLDHLRSEYRNPQTHPESTVTLQEAYGLFGAAASSINQMILACQKCTGGQKAIALADPNAATSAALPAVVERVP